MIQNDCIVPDIFLSCSITKYYNNRFYLIFTVKDIEMNTLYQYTV